tara:strand:- start:571 stop:957 length:387 start_codon:yes stop_codon:yes gene_type:complete
MPGISPKLPLQTNGLHGTYILNETFKEATKQNLKNLIMTVPGERVMDPFFGVGLRTMLFEMDNVSLRGSISAKILQQVEFYMPHVEILDISFSDSESGTDFLDHLLSMQVKYKLLPINDDDILDITAE